MYIYYIKCTAFKKKISTINWQWHRFQIPVFSCHSILNLSWLHLCAVVWKRVGSTRTGTCLRRRLSPEKVREKWAWLSTWRSPNIDITNTLLEWEPDSCCIMTEIIGNNLKSIGLFIQYYHMCVINMISIIHQHRYIATSLLLTLSKIGLEVIHQQDISNRKDRCNDCIAHCSQKMYANKAKSDPFWERTIGCIQKW